MKKVVGFILSLYLVMVFTVSGTLGGADLPDSAFDAAMASLSTSDDGIDIDVNISPLAQPVMDDGPSEEESIALEIFHLVNAARIEQGKPELLWDANLQGVTDIRASELLKSYSHTRPDGTTCFMAIKNSGIKYKTAAENIATGQTTSSQVMSRWMNSEGHRKNILGDFTMFSCSVVKNPDGSKYGGYSFVQMFYAPKEK